MTRSRTRQAEKLLRTYSACNNSGSIQTLTKYYNRLPFTALIPLHKKESQTHALHRLQSPQKYDGKT